MSTAQQEAVAMALFTVFFLLVLVLAVRFQRRGGRRHPWFWPSALLVVVGVVLTVVTASGVALTGY